jgi:dihydrofolate reductase
MKIQCHVFIAISLDGYIAREDGQIDWLEQYNATLPKGEDCGYASFYDSMDCIVLGRKSFEKVLSFSQWPYSGKRVIVMSRSANEREQAQTHHVVFTSETPTELVARLENEGLNNVYVDGGELIQSFLRLDLIQSMTTTRIPILLGKGKRLFGDLDSDKKVILKESKSWPFGFVQDHYIIPQK